MKTVLKFAASTLVIGTLAVGCTPGGSHVSSASSVSPRADRQAAREADKAVRALAKQELAEALQHAETAVTLSPRDAGYRATLGQAYLRSGRFQSAETSFSDAVALGDTRGWTELNLVLTQIALGKVDAARERIDGLQGRVAEADRGLALALTGDKSGAIAVLEAAARVEGADAKTRQNLALAYALDGRWAEAQSAAAQDLPPQLLFQRMREWSQFAQPRSAWDQVAHLLGVTPVNDPGQPVALALAPDEPAQLAAAEAPQAEPMPPADVASAETPTADAPVADALVPQVAIAQADTAQPILPTIGTAPLEASTVQQAPLLAAPLSAAAMPVAPVRAARVSTASPSRSAAAPRRTLQQQSGRYVVQLGAFSTAANAERAWGSALRRVSLTDYTPSSVTFRRASGVVHRLTLAGFASRADAANVCSRIRSRGGECFVRAAAGEQPARWANTRRVQLASR